MRNRKNLEKSTIVEGDDKFECPECGANIDIDKLLTKYGPDGLYELARQLMEAADKDVSDSYFEPYT